MVSKGWRYYISGANLVWKLGGRGSGFENWGVPSPKSPRKGGV